MVKSGDLLKREVNVAEVMILAVANGAEARPTTSK
jgi:hypothetical protein